MEASVDNKKARQLSPAEISTFCAQIALILKAGIPVQEGIAIMVEDSSDNDGLEVLGIVQEYLDLGEPFHMALAQSGVFPKYMLDMVSVGEESGRLDEVMDSLCAYYERGEAISKNLREAVLYPALMVVMMIAVILILIVKVLPIFNEVFIQLGSQMSSVSLGIMRFGTLLSRYSTVIVAVAALAALGVLLARRTVKGREACGRLFHSFFGTRRLAEKISAGRFANSMSLMLSSGLDVDQSLNMSKSLVDDSRVQAKIERCQRLIDEGSSFSDALFHSEIFTGVYARMVSVGFKTGSVDSVMRKIADRYEEEIDTQITGMISVLEPTLVAVLSIIVGMILLSVMLPLMGIMSTIG